MIISGILYGTVASTVGKRWLIGPLRVEFETNCFVKKSAFPFEVDAFPLSEINVIVLTDHFSRGLEKFAAIRT